MQTNDEALELGRASAARPSSPRCSTSAASWPAWAGATRRRDAYEEGLQISCDLGDEMYVSVFLSNLSYLADHRGDHEEARRLTHRALGICWSQGRRLMAAWTVSQLAGPEHAMGRPELGARLIGAGDEALRVLGARRHPGDVPEHDPVVAAIRAALGDERFEAVRSEGARMTLDEALDLVLDHAGS